MRDTEEILKADQQDTSTEWDWVMMKWPTSHNTRSKEISKVEKKQFESFSSSALRTLHVAKLQAQANVRENKFSRTSWWIDDQELRDGLTGRNYMWERILRRSRYEWAQPERDEDGIGKFVLPIPTQESWKSLRSDWWATAHGTLFLLLFFWLSWSLSFCCTESEDSSDSEFSEFIPATACVWLILSWFCVWCNCTLSSTVCKCTLCQQRKSHQLQQTFRGVMTPSLTLVRPGHWLLLDGLLWVSLSLSSFTRQRCLSQDDQPLV